MPDIRHQVIIEAPPEKIYSAITTREGLSAWWTPDTAAKPEVGSVAHFPFGPYYFKEMKIIELKPFERVKWLCIKGAEEWIGTSILFKLEFGDHETLLSSHSEMTGQIEQQRHSGQGTIVIFNHNDWKEYTPMFAECNYTWAQFLRSLKLLCETGKGRPWPYQHRTESETYVTQNVSEPDRSVRL